MNAVQSLAAGLAIVTLVGCTSAAGADPLTLRSLGKGGFSGIKDVRQEVIKDKAAWEKLWTEHTKTTRTATPVPEVDFAKEMVIVATQGTKRTGGYSVEIVSAEPAGKKFRVAVKQASPPPGALAIQALTAPFHFVAVPRSDLEVEFIEPKAEGK
ncbi:MAG TPA: protease complex subunit PrcB family protein [Verrucomicrobiae bacterium]|nr:protease complex subunit PrcB family protein [Verrucomicrobiae bacterium]